MSSMLGISSYSLCVCRMKESDKLIKMFHLKIHFKYTLWGNKYCVLQNIILIFVVLWSWHVLLHTCYISFWSVSFISHICPLNLSVHVQYFPASSSGIFIFIWLKLLFAGRNPSLQDNCHRLPSSFHHLCSCFAFSSLTFLLPFQFHRLHLFSCKEHNSLITIKRQIIFILVTRWLHCELSIQIEASLLCVNLRLKDATTLQFTKGRLYGRNGFLSQRWKLWNFDCVFLTLSVRHLHFLQC